MIHEYGFLEIAQTIFVIMKFKKIRVGVAAIAPPVSSLGRMKIQRKTPTVTAAI